MTVCRGLPLMSVMEQGAFKATVDGSFGSLVHAYLILSLLQCAIGDIDPDASLVSALEIIPIRLSPLSVSRLWSPLVSVSDVLYGVKTST